MVVKLGGSLYDRAQDIAGTIAALRRPVLVVPGGGAFAGAVRATGLGGSPAHWMAIAAMEQFGHYLSSFGLPVTCRLEIPPVPTVLLPYALLRDHDPLPHRWEVTSDTISAWIAQRLEARLVLLKSVDGICSRGVLLPSVDRPVPTDDVDPCLIPFVLSHRVPAVVVNGRFPARVSAAVNGEPVTGTTIGF